MSIFVILLFALMFVFGIIVFDLLHGCKYDQTNQGIKSWAMQQIVSNEVNGDHSLSFKETLIQEQ